MSGGEVTGLFRDAEQARRAAHALQRQGMAVPEAEALPQDAAGVHVRVTSAGPAELVESLLLRYGAYSAAVSGSGG